MGKHPFSEGADICRAEGGQLPLPKNDEENEYFLNVIGGGMIDSFDFDGDEIWHDSYGNVVTYFAPFWYYPFPAEGPWQYRYMSASESKGLWTVYPNLGSPTINCMIPLAPVPEPPTPVEGKTSFSVVFVPALF